MRAFVTGGSGFVGRALIHALRRRGDDVAALARSDASASVVSELGAEPIRGDLNDDDALARGATGCGVVFHSAALVDDWGRREDFVRINVRGTEQLIAATRAAGVPRLVHVSTEAVLAGGPAIVDADETWARARRPLGLYPETKGLAEQRVIAANGDGLTTVVIRPRLIWGRGDTSVLPKVIAAVERGDFRWVGGGDYLTSTCHVDNVVEGALLAAERGRGGEIYFLTDGEPRAFREFMTAMLATQGVDPGARRVPRWAARGMAWTIEAVWKLFRIRRNPPLTRTAICLIGGEVTVSDAKARRELGYVGHTTVADGLADMRDAADTRAGDSAPGTAQ